MLSHVLIVVTNVYFGMVVSQQIYPSAEACQQAAEVVVESVRGIRGIKDERPWMRWKCVPLETKKEGQ